jgi:aryl-alcohol dehydrogenase-like predicted oxidoreductase
MGLLPFQPLTGGLLTGKYRRGAPPPEGARMSKQGPADGRSSFTLTERNLAITEDLIAFAEARGRTMVELAFSWLLCQPIVASVIAGATKPDQLEQNVKSGGWKLSAEELAEIDVITNAHGPFQGKPMPQ